MSEEMLIDLKLEGLSFEKILKVSGMDKMMLVKLYEKALYNSNIRNSDVWLYRDMMNDYKENFYFINLFDNKVVFLADTHIGSREENIEYLEQFKDFILKEKISLLFHCGDICDGMVKNRKEQNCSRQIEYILKTYPVFENTSQYLLGGNHDEKYKMFYEIDILTKLSNLSSNIHSLGYSKAYFKVYDKFISLEHNCKMDSFVDKSPSLRILGHSHRSKFKKGKVYLPASCDENPCGIEDFIPGFMVMESKKRYGNVELEFFQYSYTDNGPENIYRKTYTLIH